MAGNVIAQPTNTKRWRPRFTIRELFVWTLVVAMVAGWWIDRSALQEQVDDAQRRIQFLETSRYFDPIPSLQGR